ncbi:MAG: glucose 1-dehydrogenase [Verrucomicrobia bacterium]|nr:glucose 1-dehydrogenase [Verrucomicrobiota bacterium]
MELKGKAALITGGSRGVGRATALALAKGGCAVAINFGQSRDEAEQTAAEIRSLGVQAVCIQADVSDDRACRQMVESAVREIGRLDILINNAGTTKFITHSNLEDATEEIWDRLFAVNLKGPFFCMRAARPHLEASEDGNVVNVASVAGITGMGSSIPYCASKAAVINLTLSMARVLAPKVRVNAVAPGFIAGKWTQDGLGANYESSKTGAEKRAVLGKVCLPEDVADAILALITGSRLVTGQTVVCDGGFLVGPKG